MTWGYVAIAGATLVGSAMQSQAQKKSAKELGRAGAATIEQQRAAREFYEKRTQPLLNLGQSAGDAIADMLGLQVANPRIAELQQQLDEVNKTIDAGPQFYKKRKKKSFLSKASRVATLKDSPLDPSNYTTSSGRSPRETIGLINGQAPRGYRPLPFDEQGLNAQKARLESEIAGLQQQDKEAFQARGQQGLEQINPLVSFMRDEGFEAIQEQAAANKRLGAGGTLKDLTRFNTRLASTIVPQLQNQRFNQLFSLLGIGGQAAVGQGGTALQTASNIGNVLGGTAAGQAQSIVNQGDISANALGQLAGAFNAYQGGSFANQQAPINNPALNQAASTNFQYTGPQSGGQILAQRDPYFNFA